MKLDESNGHKEFCDGLKLLGWRFNMRLTDEDILCLVPIVEKAIDYKKKDSLTQNIMEDLSLEAYKILRFQYVGVQDRADSISCLYYNSEKMRPYLCLVDEATLAFYRGYYTCALSLLFSVLESYLRAISRWQPGDSNVNTRELRQNILRLPNQSAAQDAYEIANIVYATYDASSPPDFNFSRHGLLHGIRNSNKYDEMNCARIFQLYDLLCYAEDIKRTAFGNCLNIFNTRYTIYSKCVKKQGEINLLSIDYS